MGVTLRENNGATPLTHAQLDQNFKDFLTLTESGATRDIVSINAPMFTIGGVTVINNAKAFIVGSGTTAQRPTPATGMLWYNTTLGYLENYDGSAWVQVGGGGGGGGEDAFARTVAFLGL